MFGLPANITAMLDDLLRLGSKQGRNSLKAKGFLRGAPLGTSLKAGFGAATGGYFFLQAPLAAYATAQAPQGHKVSTAASSFLPFIGTGLATAAFGGLPGFVIGAVVDPIVQQTVGRTLQYAHDFGRENPKIHTGGDYVDTRAAYTMRMAAANEMSHSLMNARQWLGKEALALHS